MADQFFQNENPNGYYYVGGILASVLGVLFLYRLVARKRRRNGNECVKSMGTTRDKESRSVNESGRGDFDVIVVGAGVAGSALAYTLGKVISMQLNFFLPFVLSMIDAVVSFSCMGDQQIIGRVDTISLKIGILFCT